MIDTVVVIPTRFRIEALVDLLLEPVLEDTSVRAVHIYDNGLGKENLEELYELSHYDDYDGPKVTIFEAHDKTIYQMWNEGIKKAVETYKAPVNVAILNDDCLFLKGTLLAMGHILRLSDTLAAVCPDYDRPLSEGVGEEFVVEPVDTTFGRRGLAGFCFMVKGELFTEGKIPFIDETFGWWYGDDDLVIQTLSHGYKVAKIRGLPVQHEGGGSSKSLNLEPQIEKDRLYFNNKYGENRSRW